MIERLRVTGFAVAVVLTTLLFGVGAGLQPETTLRITNNVEPGVSDGWGPYCPYGDTHWLRIFDLDDDHGVIGNFCVDSVRYAVHSLSSAGSQPLTINTLCWRPSLPLEYASFELRDSNTVDQPDADGEFFEQAVGGCCDAADEDLVVEIVSAPCPAGDDSCMMTIGHDDDNYGWYYVWGAPCGYPAEQWIDSGVYELPTDVIMVVYGTGIQPGIGQFPG